MNIRSLLNKRKVLVDDIITAILLVIVLYLIIFNIKLAIMSLGVYPFFSLILYGFYRSYKGIFTRKLDVIFRVLNLSFGIASIIFSINFINALLTHRMAPASYSIYLLGMPIFLIGLAGLLKGLIVNVYSPNFRYLNILIGATTVFITVIAIIFAETGFTFHLFTLLTTLALNGIFRSALYLSEYGLSLKNLKNLKLVWFMMDNVPLEASQLEENQIKP